MGFFNYRHLPTWLESNSVFRHFFLFRKLFLIKKRFHFYGKEAEDIALLRIFPKKFKGFFVDVGCFHPVKYNNTYAFYKKGWRGINIDLDSIKIQGFKWVRSGDTNIVKAVSDKKGEVSYWTNGFYSLVNTLDKEVSETRQNYRQKTVVCDRLTNIIDGTKYKDREIDLLNIDAEGHDFKVLTSLDFTKYKPKVIIIETYHDKLEQVLQSNIFNYLKERNYNLVNWVGLSLIFKKNDLVFDK